MPGQLLVCLESFLGISAIPQDISIVVLTILDCNYMFVWLSNKVRNSISLNSIKFKLYLNTDISRSKSNENGDRRESNYNYDKDFFFYSKWNKSKKKVGRRPHLHLLKGSL